MQVTPKQASQLFNQAATKVDEIEVLILKVLGPDTDVTAQYLRLLDELKEELVADIVEFDDARIVLEGDARKAAEAAGGIFVAEVI